LTIDCLIFAASGPSVGGTISSSLSVTFVSAVPASSSPLSAPRTTFLFKVYSLKHRAVHITEILSDNQKGKEHNLTHEKTDSNNRRHNNPDRTNRLCICVYNLSTLRFLTRTGSIYIFVS
jgi:hypothetical protein